VGEGRYLRRGKTTTSGTPYPQDLPPGVCLQIKSIRRASAGLGMLESEVDCGDHQGHEFKQTFKRMKSAPLKWVKCQGQGNVGFGGVEAC